MVTITLYTKQKKRHRCTEQTFGLCGRRWGRVECFKRTASKHVYYLGQNRSPAQVGCMRQVLRPGALGRPRGIGWRGRWEGGSGWGTHVNPWLIHVNVNPWLILVNVWQKPLQYCKIISLQLIKINEKKKEHWSGLPRPPPRDFPHPGKISFRYILRSGIIYGNSVYLTFWGITKLFAKAAPLFYLPIFSGRRLWFLYNLINTYLLYFCL